MYDQKPSTVKTVQEDDKYQQLMDRLNCIKFTNSAQSVYGLDKPLFSYINNPTEDVNYVGNRGGNPYSNTYNPGWTDHLNLRWGGNQGGARAFTKLEDQMSQLMSMTGYTKRQIGTYIPSYTENNPRKEGKEQNAKVHPKKSQEIDQEPKPEEVTEPPTEPKEKVKEKAANIQVPFPSRLEEKQKWDDDEFVSFLNLFKTLNVN
ncbi:acidic leucine-rich nuclear phosphoprotein 32 family member B-like [Gossypium australe]|uniref:Acidic leucine-rich nuclear phosphoprotein 32 family member B-like n=1 Tax=Gossypium australe TaxID=47621 RepID=A0A5B6WRS0_9ROSI|nr:acidic leucine-rich nuclear phosphoprotein 32 family member B-like [Gossypium australe]